MKTVEKLLWTTGISALTAGTAYSIATYDENQVFNINKPAVIVEVNPTRQGPGYYINGVFYVDPIEQANLELKQCTELNPELKGCETYARTIFDSQVANFAVGEVVIVEKIRSQD